MERFLIHMLAEPSVARRAVLALGIRRQEEALDAVREYFLRGSDEDKVFAAWALREILSDPEPYGGDQREETLTVRWG